MMLEAVVQGCIYDHYSIGRPRQTDSYLCAGYINGGNRPLLYSTIVQVNGVVAGGSHVNQGINTKRVEYVCLRLNLGSYR